jgi:hypothetical protein
MLRTIIYVLSITALCTTKTHAHLRSLVEKVDDKDVDDRQLKTYYNKNNNGDDSDQNEIYNAGSITNYNIGQINTILRQHNKAAFTKKYRGTDRLIMTQRCSISGSQKAGVYYCVEHRTVCVVVSSISRFYGDKTLGGVCGTLPFSDSVVNSLPDNLREAYENTCGGNNCNSGR